MFSYSELLQRLFIIFLSNLTAHLLRDTRTHTDIQPETDRHRDIQVQILITCCLQTTAEKSVGH